MSQPKKVLSQAKIYAVLGVMDSVELANALERHAEKLRKDADTYRNHGNDPLGIRTEMMAERFSRLSEQVFGNVVRISEEP